MAKKEPKTNAMRMLERAKIPFEVHRYECKEFIDIYDYVDKEKYGYLIDGCQQYMGIVDNLKAHPCGTICTDFDVVEEVGVIMVKSESQGDKAKEAEAAGADFVGDDDMIQKIQSENWFGFDVVVATPDMMASLGKIARILGPKGLMPNPKAGTVTMDVTKAVTEIKAGKIEYRLDKNNIVHCPIGKVSFGADKLKENYMTLLDAIVKAKPAAAKGTYLKSIAISTTMGAGIRINPTSK